MYATASRAVNHPARTKRKRDHMLSVSTLIAEVLNLLLWLVIAGSIAEGKVRGG